MKLEKQDRTHRTDSFWLASFFDNKVLLGLSSRFEGSLPLEILKETVCTVHHGFGVEYLLG